MHQPPPIKKHKSAFHVPSSERPGKENWGKPTKRCKNMVRANPHSQPGQIDV